MRNPGLHDALKEFALEAAALLSADLDGGAELPFEVEEEPGGQSVLYRYRPLTERFIGARWPRIRALPGCPTAVRALGAGAESYLRVRGERGHDAEPALQAMLERLWEDASSFGFPEERFEHVYEEVERTLLEGATAVEFVTPLLGAEIDVERLELGSGLALVAGRGVDAPSEALWPDWPEHRGSEPTVLCVLERPSEQGSSLQLDEARRTFRGLQTALRLWSAGGVSLGPLGWVRANAGAWQSFALGPAGVPRGAPWQARAAEGEELREFLETVDSSGRAVSVAWSLARFEMGCARAHGMEALSDYLLALGVLLDARDEMARASLSLRMAALCAEEDDRRALQRRLELAFALERFYVSGGSGEGYLETVGSESPHALVLEVEDHLRALLRDVLCGYLDANLRGTADDILLESSPAAEIRVRDLRVERGTAAEAGETRSRRFARGGATETHAGGEEHDGVTLSDDWAADDDASSYSAPV